MIVSLNDLHMITNPKLLFMANDLKNKGRSNKSYTIKLVNDQYNDEHLDQIFSSKANRTVFFDCTYDIDPSLTGDVTDESDNCSVGLAATYSDDLTGLIDYKNGV